MEDSPLESAVGAKTMMVNNVETPKTLARIVPVNS